MSVALFIYTCTCTCGNRWTHSELWGALGAGYKRLDTGQAESTMPIELTCGSCHRCISPHLPAGWPVEEPEPDRQAVPPPATTTLDELLA